MNLHKLFKCQICKTEERDRRHPAGGQESNLLLRTAGGSKGDWIHISKEHFLRRLFPSSLLPKPQQRPLCTQIRSTLRQEMVPLCSEYMVPSQPWPLPSVPLAHFSAGCVAHPDSSSLNKALFFWPISPLVMTPLSCFCYLTQGFCAGGTVFKKKTVVAGCLIYL